MPEMRFVQRDEAGTIVGHYACEQTYATEMVPGDHPDIVEWNHRRELAREEALRDLPWKRLERELLAQIQALEMRIAALEKRQ